MYFVIFRYSGLEQVDERMHLYIVVISRLRRCVVDMLFSSWMFQLLQAAMLCMFSVLCKACSFGSFAQLWIPLWCFIQVKIRYQMCAANVIFMVQAVCFEWLCWPILFYYYYYCYYYYYIINAFSALTLLVEHQQERPACKKLSDEALLSLSVWSKVKMICIWSSWYHCHRIISCFIRIQIGLTFLVPAYPGCPGKEATELISVCVFMI